MYCFSLVYDYGNLESEMASGTADVIFLCHVAAPRRGKHAAPRPLAIYLNQNIVAGLFRFSARPKTGTHLSTGRWLCNLGAEDPALSANDHSHACQRLLMRINRVNGLR